MRTIFKGVVITRQAVLDALRDFDNQPHRRIYYENWLDKRNFKYAVRYNGKKYPPKRILSVASGIPVSDFIGGKPVNRVFQQLGFEVGHK